MKSPIFVASWQVSALTKTKAMIRVSIDSDFFFAYIQPLEVAPYICYKIQRHALNSVICVEL